jgi:hypothetical protein
MSFGETMISTGFIQKIVKVDLDVRINRAYPPRNRHQKVLEDTKGHYTEAEPKWLPGVANQPHLQATRPLGPTVSLRVAMSVLHRLLGCIYAIF